MLCTLQLQGVTRVELPHWLLHLLLFAAEAVAAAAADALPQVHVLPLTACCVDWGLRWVDLGGPAPARGPPFTPAGSVRAPIEPAASAP